MIMEFSNGAVPSVLLLKNTMLAPLSATIAAFEQSGSGHNHNICPSKISSSHVIQLSFMHKAM
jgi:hypothetical protein